ncbi:acyltransferase [Paenibacillus sp. YYML68]|uniref:acyltransferase n=1 Tax=Paenibacillus sp. YYML68 TaxID=2909250 RepID=UPI002490FD06|nr:acyltransferase [Paenibacillus sp. YYML68]
MSNSTSSVSPIWQPKVPELQLVRAIAIVAVLVIHATADATVELQTGSGSQAMYVLINKLHNFAVPVFILLSGLVLFYRYKDDFGSRQAVSFYTKRLKLIVIPYLVWSLFYYLYNQWIYDRSNVRFDASAFAELLPWADASYHLYFMIIIVQFYVLFPLLMGLCHKYAWIGRHLIWLGLIVHAAFYVYHDMVRPVDHMASLCLNYFSMFTLGGWIGLHYEQVTVWLKRRLGLVLACTAACGLSFAILFVLDDRKLFSMSAYTFQALFFGYAGLAALTFIRLGQWIVSHQPRVSAALQALGAASFGIYLVHPAVLTYYKVHVESPSSMLLYHGYVAGGLLVSLAVPWLLSYVYGKVVQPARQAKKASPATMSG